MLSRLRSFARPAVWVLTAAPALASPHAGGALGASAPVQPRLTVGPITTSAPGDPWLVRARRRVEEQEYHASRTAHGLQAPNRAHNLRAYFEPAGLRLNDRTASGEPELMSLRLAAFGRAGSERPVPAGEVSSAGARVEIRRPGLAEWYVNSSAGLEQGFTLDQRPAGNGRLSLRLALSSGAARSAGASAALLRTRSGRELRYAGLTVVDARGLSVPAELHVTQPNELRIEVDDAGAVYPLTVDPLLTAIPDAVLQSNQALANQGVSVAGAGDVNADGYDDVIVGAWTYDAGEANEGAAFVFLGGPTGIDPGSAYGFLQGNQAGAYLGWCVDGAGDVNGDGYHDVIVGAQNYNAGELAEGAAFVFLGGPTGIPSGDPATASAMLQANQALASMGNRLAGAGDVNADGYDDVIVGAYYYSAGEASEGAAFVFLGGPAGVASGNPATASATIQANQADAHMGWSVAGAGDVNADDYDDVIVGARDYDAGETNEGAAFVFLGGPTGITANGTPATASANLQGSQADRLMGSSVAGAGDVNGDGFDDVVVGSHDNAGEGAVFVFLGGPTGIPSGTPATASATLQSNQDGAAMGQSAGSVAGAGDVNGDGYDDVIVGAFAYDAGETDEGAAFVFLGGPTGIPGGTPASASATLQCNQASANLGYSVAGAGDLNGDGYDDVIVGAHTYDAGETDEGAAFVFLGGFVKGDVDFDLKTDLVLRHQPTGANLAWLMNGTTRTNLTAITPDPGGLDLRLAGVDDFNGDWRNDLVFWNQATGATEFWLMNGAARAGAAVPLTSALSPPWKPSATADFNRDRKPDLVWRNSATQKIRLWTMNGTTQLGEIIPTPDQAVDANWEIVAALDWNGDHATDLLWYNATSGKIVLWFMDAAVVRITGQFTVPPNAGHNNWNVVAAGDYGIGAGGLPGTKDIVWRNATSGNIVVWHMDQAGNRTAGGFTNPAAPAPNPTDWTVVGPK